MSTNNLTTIQKLIKEAVETDLSGFDSFEKFKKQFSKKNKTSFIRNLEIKEVYNQMLKNKEIQSSTELERLLKSKFIRTLSGVAVIATLTKPYKCPGECLYCPDESAMPKSYLSNEPAVMRAIKTDFDPYKQVQARLKILQLNGHQTDKIELIVMGGTFSYFPKKYQYWFIKECFRAANDFPKNDTKTTPLKALEVELEKEKKKNELAGNRIVGLTLETRPDYINEAEIINFRKLGSTRVELGVQSIFDDVLKLNKRGHSAAETVQATKLLKDSGFKINYHLMPGLLGSTPKRDLKMFKTIYSDPRFQPDMVKIYPCVVTKNSALFRIWQKGNFKPLSNEENRQLMIDIKKITPPYIRITRLIRDIPEESIVAGPNITNLRQIIQKSAIKCNCIRCREVQGNYDSNEKIVLNRTNYNSSGGKEIFLQFINKENNKLYALLRLRIPNKKESENHFISTLKNATLIREVHTYGKLTAIKNQDKKSPQHSGLGKRLITKAEQISKEEFGFNKIAVISGVGVRKYYEKNGYQLENEYIIKTLT